MGINYHQMTEAVIKEIKQSGPRPRLLLHSCCAPCATHPLVWLSDFFDITAFYDNPNIESEVEYTKRADELVRFVDEYPFSHRPQVKLASYQPFIYYDLVRGYEEEGEKGKRCSICFALRLDRTARFAKDQGFDYFTTTLSISPHKDAERLHQLGLNAARRYGVALLAVDFKKRDGYKKSVALSRDYSLYRQTYCGCVFSRDS